MATRWEERLDHCRTSLRAFQESIGVDLRYSVVHVRAGQHDFAERARPLVYSSSGPVAKLVEVPVNADEHQIHLFTGDNHEVVDGDMLKQFCARLREVAKVLSLIPRRVLPEFVLPSLPNGIDEELVRWGRVLLWLGATDQIRYQIELEFAESASRFCSDGRVSSWDETSPLLDFDPVAFITQSGNANQNWTHWKQEHTKSGRRFPEVLAASVTKPMFQASPHAIELLAERGRSQRPQPEERKLPTRLAKGKSRESTVVPKIIAALQLIHGGKNGAHDFTPREQTEISETAGVSQSSVSRFFDDYLCKLPICHQLGADRCYSRLCEEGLILRILDRLEDPASRREITNFQTEQIRASDNPADD